MPAPWETTESAGEAPPWEAATKPPWEATESPVKAPAAINPNAPGGFNYGGKNTNVAADAPSVSDILESAGEELRAVPSRIKAGVGVMQQAVEAGGAAALNIPQRMYIEATGEVPTHTVTELDAQGRPAMKTEAALMYFQPGESPVPSDATVLQPEGSHLNQLVRGLITPGTLATFPFAESKAAQVLWLSQTAPGAVDAVSRTLDPSLSPEERRAASQDALLNTLMSYGLVKHMSGTPEAARAKAVADALDSTEPAAPAAATPPWEAPVLTAQPNPGVSLEALRGLQQAMRQGQLRPQPEPAQTLKAQVAATRDPQSPKTVTLITPGEATPTDHGLTPVPTAQGLALVNPAKVDPAQAKAVFDAGGGGQLLGMSTDVKPSLTEGQPVVTVQTKTAAGTPVQDEVATPETLPAAIAAGKQLAPDGTVAVKAPQDVIAERQAAQPKLVPVTVSDKDIAAMRDAASERAPDVLDELENVTRQPVQFDPAHFGNVVSDARAATLRNGRSTAATKRLDARLSATTGLPADEVLQGLAAQNPKYAGWTGDDLAQAIVNAHAARESGGLGDAEARALAEQQARDNLFTQANQPTRKGVDSVPVEQLQLGDTFKLNGHDVTVTGFPVEAETGQSFGVELDGAYGKQTVPVGQTVNPDKGTLQANSNINSGALGQFGMGGAKPGEFGNSPVTATGIKNATVDRERAFRGLPPAMEPARQSFGQAWDDAMARVDNDPAAADKLVEELKAQPRALTGVEDALLLHRQVELQNEYGKMTRELAQAYDDAKEFPSRMADVEQLKLQTAALADRLQELYDVNQAAGSETGRGLAMRKMMAYEDYTLANMEVQLRAAKGGVPLSDTERAQITQLQERIAATQKAFDEYQKQVEEERRQRQVNEEITARIEQVKNQPGHDRQVQTLADRIVAAISKEAEAARERMRERMKRFNAGVDPTMLSDLAIIGAEHIAKGVVDFTRWSKAMVGEFGEHVVPWLNQAWLKANARVDTAVDRLAKGKQSIEVKQRVRKDDVDGQRANIVAGLKQAQAEGADLADQGAYIRRLAENFILSGITEREPLIDAVHGVLTSEINPNLTRRETMDAISGYGQYKQLDPDAIKAQLRDLRGQMQQVAKLEDVQARKPLLKTGLERRTPSDAERRLLQQVNEAKRQFGVVTTDPARQLKSALDAIKTRLGNQIKDLEYQLSTKQRIVKTRTESPFDAESQLLQVRRDDLKRQLDELVPKPGMTDAKRAEIAQRNIERSIADLDQRIKVGDITIRSRKPTVTTLQLEALKAQRDALKAQYQELVDTLAPERREQAQLSALKTRLANSTADYLDRAARGDFSTIQRREVKLDAEAQRLKAANEKAKNEFERAKIAARLAQRTAGEKAAAAFLRWRRGFLLSSPVTLAKLSAAAFWRTAITPVEEGLGWAIGKAIPSVAERAPREGGFNVSAEAKAFTEGVMQGMADAKSQFWTGKSELDFLYGKNKDGAVGEHDLEPRSVVDFFGHLHGALKAPVKRAEFSRSFEKRAAYYMRQGVDVTDPMVETRIAMEAYKDANRSIFMQDNRVVDAYKAMLARLEQPDKTTGKTPVGTKAIALTARTMLPIVKVPANIVAETLQYTLGSATGLGRLGLALRRGVETLKPEEADLIMRELKKGSLGAALLVTGFLLPSVVGGYYQRGEKRKAGEVKAGNLQIGGWNVPTFLLHNPLLETLQIGATVRRVMDTKLHKSDQTPQGVWHGIMAGALGLVDEVPFFREMTQLDKLMDPNERGQYLAELAKSVVIPQFVQWTAQQLDRDAAGNTIPRKPESFPQTMESGIPGLRGNVPIKVTPETASLLSHIQKSTGAQLKTPAQRHAWDQAALKTMLGNPNTATNAALMRAMGR